MDETKNMVNNDFNDIMLNRHSYRKFKTDVKISRKEINEMLEETLSAPSACNLQSWHFVVCDDEEGKKKARSVMMPFNYPQTDTSSALIFVLGDTQSHYKYRDVWNKACENGQISPEERDKVFKTFLPLYEHATGRHRRDVPIRTCRNHYSVCGIAEAAWIAAAGVRP